MTKAYEKFGHLSVFFGSMVVKQKYRAILQQKPNPAPLQDSDYESDDQSGTQDESDEDEASDDENNDENAEGPNDRGTYSKEYTLKHPEIKWVHRGQGRYLPASEVKVDPPALTPRPTRYAARTVPHGRKLSMLVLTHYRKLPERATTTSSVTSHETMEQMLNVLRADFDEFRLNQNPNARPGWSPQLRGSWNAITALLKESPRRDWPRVVDAIENPDHRAVVRKWVQAMERTFPSSNVSDLDRAPSRPSRQARSLDPSSSDHRRSSRLVDVTINTYDESDGEPEETDDEVDANIGLAAPRSQTHIDQRSRGTLDNVRSTRRGSSTSYARASEASHDLSGDTAVKKDDLYKHAGRIVHHRGNQFYRPGPSHHGIKGTKLVLADGELLGLHELSVKDAEDLLAKASKNNFGLTDPRGALPTGQYNSGRRKSSMHSMATESTAPTTWSSARRASKAESSSKFETDEVPRGIVSRRFSTKSSLEVKDALIQENKLKPTRSKSDPDILLDKDYVDARPNEIFHHRGQGKWARGLPPPGSSNKMAVRGPNAKELFDAMQRGEDVDENGVLLPPITALLRREEGPDLFPQFEWHYRGGGKHCRLTKEEAERYEAGLRPAKKQRTSIGSRQRGDGPEAQLHREAQAAEAGSANAYSGKGKANALLLRPAKVIRKRSQQTALHSKASSNAESKAPTPKPPPLAPEDDRLTDADLPSLYKDEWSDLDDQETDDEAARFLRERFRPIVGSELFVAPLTKYDPASRSLASLTTLAENTQKALKQLQDEFLELDKLVAQKPMPGKKERKPAHGGREPVPHDVWEDKKEAMLYDYTFDPRKIGFQDPDAQRIVRDAEGRELRRRRTRIDPHTSQVNYGDGEMTTRRTVKPVSRFDGVIVPVPRKKSKLSVADTTELDDNKAVSMTPDRTGTPVSGLANWHSGDPNDYVPPSRGRWAGHVPKRIQELRGVSVPRRSESGSPQPPGSSNSSSRKGRPPGSKNLHERKDKGIKKGPRKKKDDDTSSNPGGSGSVEDEPQGNDAETESLERTPEQMRAVNPMSLDAMLG